MSHESKQPASRVPKTLFLVALFCTFELAKPSIAHAGPISVKIEQGLWKVKTGPKSTSVDVVGSELATFTVPKGTTNFTITKDPKKDGYAVITSTTPKDLTTEPTATKVAFGPDPSGGTYTVGVFDVGPEMGYASLNFTGLSTDTSAGGTLISIGIEGGATAAYDTVVGDTFANIFSSLISTLQADGVDAYESGNNLVVVSNADPDTYAGTIDFTDTDPAFQFDVEAGTLQTPESASWIMLASGLMGIVARGWGRRVPVR